MSECVFHVGDTPTIRATLKDCDGVVLPMDTATTKEIRFLAPDGGQITKTATFPAGGDGTDGIVEAQLSTGELDEAGQWYWQAYSILPTWRGFHERVPFRVDDPIF